MKNPLAGFLVLLNLSCGLPLVLGQTAESTLTASPSTQVEPPSAGGKRAREFQGDDLGQVLRLLARQAKINLMIDDAIKGNLNMHLENTSAMDAIDAIVHQYKLSMIKDDKGVYYLTAPDAAESALAAISRPETANRIAAYAHNLYTALIKEGFTPEESLQIVVASPPGEAVLALGKRTEAVPSK